MKFKKATSKNETRDIDEVQKMQDEARKKQEEQMEKVVIMSREKIVPLIKKYNLGIVDTRSVLDLVAMALNQSLFDLMKKNFVKDTGLLDKIVKDYPNYELIKEIIETLGNETLADGMGVSQWTGEKIDAILKAENKDRKVESINLDF